MSVMALEKIVCIDGKAQSYRLVSHSRSRSVRIRISARGDIVVTKPRRLHRIFAQQFVERNAAWIAEALRAHARRVAHSGYTPLPYSREASTAARALVVARLAHFNEHYRFAIGAISIRNQSTRWGSCSRAGNLSFNYRVAVLTPDLADYLVVHELCHIGEHNHSARFWALVAQTVPEYKSLRTKLRTMSLG